MEMSLTKLFGGSRYLIQSIHAKKTAGWVGYLPYYKALKQQQFLDHLTSDLHPGVISHGHIVVKKFDRNNGHNFKTTEVRWSKFRWSKS